MQMPADSRETALEIGHESYQTSARCVANWFEAMEMQCDRQSIPVASPRCRLPDTRLSMSRSRHPREKTSRRRSRQRWALCALLDSNRLQSGKKLWAADASTVLFR